MAEKKEATTEEQLKAALEENKRLTADLDTYKEDHASLTATNQDLGAIIDGLKATVEELNEALAEKDAQVAKSVKRPVIKSGKKSYMLRFKKFTHRHNGKSITVTEEVLKGNPEIVAELVKMKSGALVEIGGK